MRCGRCRELAHICMSRMQGVTESIRGKYYLTKFEMENQNCIFTDYWIIARKCRFFIINTYLLKNEINLDNFLNELKKIATEHQLNELKDAIKEKSDGYISTLVKEQYINSLLYMELNVIYFKQYLLHIYDNCPCGIVKRFLISEEAKKYYNFFKKFVNK